MPRRGRNNMFPIERGSNSLGRIVLEFTGRDGRRQRKVGFFSQFQELVNLGGRMDSRRKLVITVPGWWDSGKSKSYN